jgi:ribokinase
MDLVIQTPRLPSPGETLAGEAFATFPGGKGANQAVAAARLGAQVQMIGCVGDDGFGHTLRHTLATAAVGAQHVATMHAQASGVALITVAQGGQNTIVIAAGANAALSEAHVSAAAAILQAADVLLLQLESPLPAVTHAATLARAAGTTVILNPAPVPLSGLPADLLANVDYLIPNETEAAALLDQPTPETPLALAQAVRTTTRVPHVVVTLGAAGVVWCSAQHALHCPAFPVTAVDTTAAGDAFVAGFAVALASGLSAQEALRWGCAAGGLTATRLGAQAALPLRAEVEALLT